MFRVASPARAWWNLLKTSLQIAVFWTLFLAIVPFGLRRLEAALGVDPFTFAGQLPVGALLLACCSFLGLWSGFLMSWAGHGTPLPLDAPRALVTRGPYRILRNPMAVAGLGQGLGVGIAIGSPFVLIYVIAGGLLWHWAVRPLEEADLARRFGPAYEDYRRRVRCWIPVPRAASSGVPTLVMASQLQNGSGEALDGLAMQAVLENVVNKGGGMPDEKRHIENLNRDAVPSAGEDRAPGGRTIAEQSGDEAVREGGGIDETRGREEKPFGEQPHSEKTGRGVNSPRRDILREESE